MSNSISRDKHNVNRHFFRKVLYCILLMPGIGLFQALMLTSCSREHLDDCFSNAGPQITEDRPVDSIVKIELYDNVNLVLIPGAAPHLSVEGGKNILDAVKTDLTDGILVIRNTLTCNWVRDYNRELTVYATTPSLREIRYEGSGDITTRDTLRCDSLQISVWGGGGSFNLSLAAGKLNLAQHYGTVDFHVSGTSLITTIYSNSYGPFYCNDLISNIVYISNRGSNNCYVHVRHILEAEITSVGDIYYSGNPYSVTSTVTGSGRLVKTE